MFEMDDGSKNSQGVTLIIMPKSQDLRFVLIPGHQPDSLLLSLELISYLKVICAQSWQHIEALWDLRSPKICPKLAQFLKQIEKKHPVFQSNLDLEGTQKFGSERYTYSLPRESKFKRGCFFS